MKEPIWISQRVVIAIHRRQLAEHGGSDGIRDEGLLDSALARPINIFAYSESPPDIATLAAAYAYGIVKNHPFIDGNKRTSYIACRTFLKLNGCDVEASDEEKYQTWIAIAANRISEEELRDWIRNHVKYSR
jgi:death on curing protein